MEKLLQTEQICYSYEENVPVLNHASTTFYIGEKVAVIGSDGPGKSTFSLNLNGALTPDSGTIWYRDKEIGKKEKSLLRQHVSSMFQDADQQIIAPMVTAEASLRSMNLKLDRNGVQRRAEHVMEVMDLMELAERVPHNLSGRRKKQVSIADTMIMELELILLDKSTIALDPQNQQVLKQVLEELTGAGRTLVVSTHDMNFAYRSVDRISVLDERRTTVDDVPENMFSREDVLIRASLRLLVMMRIIDFLKEKGIIEDGFTPRMSKESKAML